MAIVALLLAARVADAIKQMFPGGQLWLPAVPFSTATVALIFCLLLGTIVALVKVAVVSCFKGEGWLTALNAVADKLLAILFTALGFVDVAAWTSFGCGALLLNKLL